MENKIAIIGCKASKQDYECPADEMYSKSWIYKAQRDFISHVYNAYFILSTGYGVIEPTRVIKPYNTTLYDKMDIKGAPKLSDEDETKLLKQSAKVINEMEGEIDLHLSAIYYKKLNKYLTKEVKHIKQQPSFGQTKHAYNEGLEMYNGDNLNECLEHIQKKRKSIYNEQAKWFIHPEHGEFYGKSSQLRRAFPNLDEGNAYTMSTGRTKTHMGWRIK
jgi:hypothetical protein